MSRAVSGRRSAMRKATSESCRMSLSVSWDTPAYCSARHRRRRERPRRFSATSAKPLGRLGRDPGGLEVLVRRAVLAIRQRRALARLPLARRRVAARDPAVERARLDLLLDELDG